LQRLRHRRGPKKAICAVAALILTAAYRMLRDSTLYQDLGADLFRRISPEIQANRLARQIAKLVSTCTLTPVQDREKAGIRPSMDSVGDAYDNAMCESFFTTLECELLEQRRFATIATGRSDCETAGGGATGGAEAEMACLSCIEGWYTPYGCTPPWTAARPSPLKQS